MQPSCCRGFSAAKNLPNPKLEKERKFFTQGLSKQDDFASQEFLVVIDNDLGISVEWLTHPPLEGGGGVTTDLLLGAPSQCHIHHHICR